MAIQRLIPTLIFTLLAAFASLFGAPSSLYKASREGDIDRMLEILMEKPNRTLLNRALLNAAQFGHRDLAELLLDAGANVNTKDVFGWTPLHEASRYGHTAVVVLLLARGADGSLGEFTHDWTPLYFATKHHHDDIVELLASAE